MLQKPFTPTQALPPRTQVPWLRYVGSLRPTIRPRHLHHVPRNDLRPRSTLGHVTPPRASVKSGHLLLRSTREHPSLTKRHALPPIADPSLQQAQHPANFPLELLPHETGHVPQPRFVQTPPPPPSVGSEPLLVVCDRIKVTLEELAVKSPPVSASRCITHTSTQLHTSFRDSVKCVASTLTDTNGSDCRRSRKCGRPNLPSNDPLPTVQRIDMVTDLRLANSQSVKRLCIAECADHLRKGFNLCSEVD